MRHNQNGRHVRGRRGNSGQHGGNHSGHHSGQRRGNPRIQTFDSNGPDVRIRGNAIQVNEKYLALARDAASAGDRVLAESYHQHAEHYQRLINEANEDQERSRALQNGPQPGMGNGADGTGTDTDENLPDLDQGFLVGRKADDEDAPTTRRDRSEVAG